MFWNHENHHDGGGFEQLFRSGVRSSVWNGDRTAIRRLLLDLGAQEMLTSKSPQAARERMRQALREALLEPNAAVQRDIFTDRFLFE